MAMSTKSAGMSKIMHNIRHPKPKFEPCNTNNIHPEKMNGVSEERRVCVSLSEMRERESADDIVYLLCRK